MFYTFHQNNSGGSFTYNKGRGITEFVVVEADSEEEANERAREIGIYFDGCESGMDCECCGDRWYPAYDGHDEPLVYGEPALNRVRLFADRVKEGGVTAAVVHYKDGTVVWAK